MLGVMFSSLVLRGWIWQVEGDGLGLLKKFEAVLKKSIIV
jgi:hypothetical protein